MASITILSPDMVAHLGGCADITRRRRNRYVNVSDEAHANHYEGETLIDAILAADADLASWFGEKPYQDGMTHWTVATCEIEPCLAKAIRAAGIAFNDRGRPVVGVERDVEVLIEQTRKDGQTFNRCTCGCGGFPKGKKSRFLPGHDAKFASSVKSGLKVAERMAAATTCGKLNGKWKCQRPAGHTGHCGTKVA